MSNPPPSPQDLGVQFIQQKRIKKDEPHSKRTLGFGIASLITAETAFQYGVSFRGIPITEYLPRYVPVLFIILSIVHVVGLIFGIVSRINNQQARELESMNTFIKVGNVLGIIGILINTILIVISFVIIGLLW